MRYKILKKIMGVLTVGCLLAGSILPAAAATEPFEEIGKVKPSNTAYAMMISDTGNSFLRNEKAVDMKVGERFYLTYTVDEVEKKELSQNGIIITRDGEEDWPYVKGMMKYDFTTDLLLEKGATYFYRMEVTKEGFSYVIAKKSSKESKWIELPESIGDFNTGCKYFGVWFAGVMNAKLSSVMFYDAKGTDLGVHMKSQSGNTVIYTNSLLNEKEVGQYYEFTLNNEANIAISNAVSTDSDAVYMTYQVENVKNNDATQVGVAYSKGPKDQYPHASGVLSYDLCEKGSPLFMEGASYVVYAAKENGELRVLVKRTIKGKEEIFSFPSKDGTFQEDAGYFSLWIGEGVEHSVTADIKNFRCYDKNGQNLGVQTNKETINITKYGELEDYSQCEAVYWCEETNRQIVLEDTQKAVLETCGDQDSKEKGTYSITGSKLTMKMDGKKSEYKYYYAYMTDSENHRYNRLKDTKVTFVAGAASEAGTWTVDVTSANGYKVNRPANPTVEGDTFKEWCTADGKAFDFDRYVTESVTIYAKYQNGDGNEYLAIETGKVETSNANDVVYILCAAMILVTGILVVLMYRRSKKHA